MKQLRVECWMGFYFIANLYPACCCHYSFKDLGGNKQYGAKFLVKENNAMAGTRLQAAMKSGVHPCYNVTTAS